MRRKCFNVFFFLECILFYEQAGRISFSQEQNALKFVLLNLFESNEMYERQKTQL